MTPQGCHTSSLECVLEGMSTTTPIDTGLRPDWLAESVWPFPLRLVDVGGRRVVVTDTGGPGPVLLFCHAGMWSLLWRGLIGELASTYRCVAFDPPGSGLSERVPADEQHLTTVARTTGAVLEHLDLRDCTLVLHDLGGVAALAGVEAMLDRIAGVVAINTFAWRPGVVLGVALRTMGSAMVRELDVVTGFLARGSSTRLGVGRHLDRAARRAWREGLRDRPARRAPHRLFRDAARNRAVVDAAERSLLGLGDRPLLTIFGQFGDYFGFARGWRRRRPDARQHLVRRGLHFPMCDAPALVAGVIDEHLRAAC